MICHQHIQVNMFAISLSSTVEHVHSLAYQVWTCYVINTSKRTFMSSTRQSEPLCHQHVKVNLYVINTSKRTFMSSTGQSEPLCHQHVKANLYVINTSKRTFLSSKRQSEPLCHQRIKYRTYSVNYMSKRTCVSSSRTGFVVKISHSSSSYYLEHFCLQHTV